MFYWAALYPHPPSGPSVSAVSGDLCLGFPVCPRMHLPPWAKLAPQGLVRRGTYRCPQVGDISTLLGAPRWLSAFSPLVVCLEVKVLGQKKKLRLRVDP